MLIIANNESTEEQKVAALNKLAYSYRVKKPDSTLILGTRSLEIATNSGNQFGVGDAKLAMATAQTNLGNYYEAIKGFREARLIFEELKDIERIASCINNIGALYNSLNEFDQAQAYFLQAMKLYEETEEIQMISATTNNVGYIYKIQEDYEQALTYLYKALAIAREAPVDYFLYPVYNLGSVYMHKNMLDSAQHYLVRALDLSKELKDNYVLSLTLMDLGVLSMKEGMIEKAEAYFLEANTIATEAGLGAEQLKSVKFLSEVYERKNSAGKALLFHKQYKEKNDSLYNIDLNKKISFLEAQSKLSEDEIKIEVARRESELIRQNELANAIWTRNTLIVGLIMMFLISYLLYKNSKRRQSANNALQKLNTKIEAQAEELKAANDEITTMNANLEALVDERTQELQIKNAKLREYLSSNSHIVRAPLARILGLIEQFDPQDPKLVDFISDNIHKSATELDDALRDINEKLSAE